MNKKAWAAKFKKYAVLVGINEPKKSCHGVRKARAEVAAYADCTESQMMAMFGRTDPKMPAHYIAEAKLERSSGSSWHGEKMVTFDQRQITRRLHAGARRRTTCEHGSGANEVVALPGNIRKNTM